MKYLFITASILLFLMPGCNKDSGTSTPQVRILSVTPNQITAGSKDLEMEIAGTGFTSVTSVSCGNDITVKHFEVQDTTRIHVSVEVGLDAPPGPRTVTVITSSASAQLDSGLAVVANKKPKASFTFDPPTGSQGTLFTFDGRGSSDADGRVKKYHWDFGDHNDSTKAVEKHKFQRSGKYLVVLTVEDDATLEDSAQHAVTVVFDPAIAAKEIDAVCKEFLRLFGDLETLTAEEIVVGFSTARGCPGRQHEIDIINLHKAEGANVSVDILQPVTEVQNITEDSATSNLGARFYGRNADGTSFDGIVTHYFQMRNESDGWKICNFTAQ